MIPVIIIHKGNQLYFENCIRITSKTNKVYLLGDSTNEHFQSKYNITHVHIDSLEQTDIMKKFITHFKNYSTNNHNFELICFLRMFWLYEFSKKFNIPTLFHTDSDCVILYDINTYQFKKDIAYSVCKDFGNPNRMSASVHNALLNKDFFDTFISLCNDIYISGTKFNLFASKIKHHADNKMSGGICDMTIYHLIQKQLDVQNLLEEHNGFIFLNNINGGEGSESKTQYEIENGLTKLYSGSRVYDTINKKHVRLFSIHFSGTAKRYLEFYQ